jgi:hypothetical protein
MIKTNFQTTTSAGMLADSSKIVGLPAADYHADLDAQSCSLLKPMLVSPAHYKDQFFNASSGSKSKDFGTLLHTLLLEPPRLAVDYAVFPGRKDGRDRDYKDFCVANAGKAVIDDVSLQETRTLAEKMMHRLVRGRPFGDYIAEGEKEVTIYFTDPSTGVRCRSRIDLLHPEIIFDVKSAVSVVKNEWLRQALNFNYDMQGYMYLLAECLYAGRDTPLPFVFMVGENDRPYSVSVLTAGESFLAKGAGKYKTALTAYAACSRVNHWPDLGEDDTLELDPWMAVDANEPAWRAQLAVTAAAIA